MVAETNQAYAASGVRQRLALAHRSEVAYTESGDSGVDLRRLSDPSDGHMDEVHAVRDRIGADLVHLIVGDEEYDVCGIAYRPGVFGITLTYCGGATFAHELGHNMGLLHDRYRVRHDEGEVSPHPAYGYVNQRMFDAGPPSSRWRTIMSYDTQCADADLDCTELLRFSNPRQRYAGDPLGVPYGVSASGLTGPADAVAVLNATGPAVAPWRDPPRTNRPPTVMEVLSDRTLAPGSALHVDVSRAFADPDGDALAYTASSSAPRVVRARGAGTRVTLTALGVGAATITVTATDTGGSNTPAAQSFTATVTAPFTDDPIRIGVTPIRAVHFTELRTRIDPLRRAAGLSRFRWTDSVLTAGTTRVRLAHLLELRVALTAAYVASGRPHPVGQTQGRRRRSGRCT